MYSGYTKRDELAFGNNHFFHVYILVMKILCLVRNKQVKKLNDPKCTVVRVRVLAPAMWLLPPLENPQEN